MIKKLAGTNGCLIYMIRLFMMAFICERNNLSHNNKIFGKSSTACTFKTNYL